MDISNYYEILGISRNASQEEIRKAFRQKAKQFHPDVTGAEGSYMFQLINEAYDVLSAQSSRADYDLTAENNEAKKDINDGWEKVTENYKTRSKGHVEIKQSLDRLGNLKPVPDVSTAQESTQSKDETSQNKVKPNIKFRDNQERDNWGQLNSKEKNSKAQDSLRSKKLEGSNDKRTYQFSITPLECIIGTHREIALNLDDKTSKATVYIHPGIKHGIVTSLAVIPLEVDQLLPETIDAVILVTNSDYLEIDGLNLTLHLPLTIKEAMDGVETVIPTAKGTVKVSIPPLNVNRKPLRVKGHGIEDPQSKERGDLIVRPFIVPPDRASEALEQALRACDAHYSFDIRAHLPKSFSK